MNNPKTVYPELLCLIHHIFCTLLGFTIKITIFLNHRTIKAIERHGTKDQGDLNQNRNPSIYYFMII